MISSRLGELLWSLQGILFLMVHYSYFMSWEIDILDTIMNRRQSLPTSPLFQSDPKRNQSKVSAPELNHDYISYSDIKIRYRFNRGSGSLISLDHVRIRRPIESSCSWMLHRNPSLFLSSTEKGFFRITRAISLFLNSFFFSLW